MSRNCCDYGCDRSSDCPAGSLRAECHVACSPPPGPRAFLAPGVLDGPYRRLGWRRIMTARQMDAISRAVLVMVVLAAVAGACGFVVGYLEVGGLLP